MYYQIIIMITTLANWKVSCFNGWNVRSCFISDFWAEIFSLLTFILDTTSDPTQYCKGMIWK